MLPPASVVAKSSWLLPEELFMFPTVAHPPIMLAESSATLAALIDAPPETEKFIAPPAVLRAKLETLAEPSVRTAPAPLALTLVRPDPRVSVPSVSVVGVVL